MKNLKVRVWDYSMNQMIYAGDEEYLFTITENGVKVDDLTYTVTVDENEVFEDIKCEVMLGSRILDKNKNQIYRGDIIKFIYDYDGKEYVSEVKGNLFEVDVPGQEYDFIPLEYITSDDTFYNFEIIGNVFENPKLVGEDKR